MGQSWHKQTTTKILRPAAWARKLVRQRLRTVGDSIKSVVGFEEVYRQPDNQASFLSNGNTYHDLALTDIRSKYAAKDQKPGIWHLAFELETEADMVDGYNRAKAGGVDFPS